MLNGEPARARATALRRQTKAQAERSVVRPNLAGPAPLADHETPSEETADREQESGLGALPQSSIWHRRFQSRFVGRRCRHEGESRALDRAHLELVNR